METIVFLVIISSAGFAKTLNEIIIEGLVIKSQEQVTNYIPLSKGSEVSSSDIQKAIKSLYKTGLFKDIQVFTENETTSSVSLRFLVEENPICELIEFHGLKKVKQKDLEEKMTISTNEVISDVRIHENIRIIKDVYAEQGYLLVNIKPSLIESRVPGNVILKFDIKEGKKVRIKQITFTGNKAFTVKKLKRKFETKEKKWFYSGEYKEDQYRQHIDTLLIFYHDKGYLDAKVVNDSVWYSEDNRYIFINIDLDEGKRYYRGDFFFTGNKVLTKEALANTIALKKGKPFDQSRFDMTKMMISNAYREEGYLWVQVQEQNRFRSDTIDVTFNIVEGRPAIVRKIDIKGNVKTREKVIRRELMIYPGQRYKQSLMERSYREVMMLNYFDKVTPDLKPNEDGTIDLVYTVEEKETVGQFSAGIMYSQVDKLGGNFNITMSNFRGAGQQVDANIEFAKNRQKYSLGFLEPWIFDNPTSFSIEGFYEKSKSGSYDFYSTGFELGSGRKLKWPDDYYSIFLKYRLSYERDNRYQDIEKPHFTILEDGLLSRLSITLRRNDTRGTVLFPVKGSIFSLNTQIAGIGGDFHYVKGLVDFDWYFSLFWKFVLGAKHRFGLIDGIRNEKKIARADLFAAGGVYYDGQIRGYSEGAFGRFNNEGLALTVFSYEIRFPVVDQQLYLAAFMDIGNTYNDIADIDLSEMYTGAGMGVRLNLPMVGLIGFDFAWGLKDYNHPHFDGKISPKPVVHFLMQQGF